MNTKEYRTLVREVLGTYNLWSKPAEDLVVGTSIHESGNFRYNKQVKGPALGYIQMEPATYKDLWLNYLAYKPELADKIEAEFGKFISIQPETLIDNPRLGVVMCRVHYLRKPGSIPVDLEGQAKYWKKHYNTYLGRGTAEQYVKAYLAHNVEV